MAGRLHRARALRRTRGHDLLLGRRLRATAATETLLLLLGLLRILRVLLLLLLLRILLLLLLLRILRLLLLLWVLLLLLLLLLHEVLLSAGRWDRSGRLGRPGAGDRRLLALAGRVGALRVVHAARAGDLRRRHHRTRLRTGDERRRRHHLLAVRAGQRAARRPPHLLRTGRARAARLWRAQRWPHHGHRRPRSAREPLQQHRVQAGLLRTAVGRERSAVQRGGRRTQVRRHPRPRAGQRRLGR